MNEEIKIEKGIPLPSQEKTGITAALRKLNIGDSFEANVSSAAHSFARQIGITIKTRKQENGKTRVWRIA